MVNTGQNDWRKGVRRQDSRRKTDLKKIKVEGNEDKEQEVTVRPGTSPQKKAGSVWNWQEEFRVEWSETFLTKKKKKHPRKGE